MLLDYTKVMTKALSCSSEKKNELELRTVHLLVTCDGVFKSSKLGFLRAHKHSLIGKKKLMQET